MLIRIVNANLKVTQKPSHLITWNTLSHRWPNYKYVLHFFLLVFTSNYPKLRYGLNYIRTDFTMLAGPISRLSTSRFFCTIKLLWLNILRRSMHWKLLTNIGTWKKLSNCYTYVILVQCFPVLRSLVQNLRRLSNILCNCVIAW